MKVRATQTGFYDLKRRYAGDEFTLRDPKLFSEKWMERLDSKPVSKVEVVEDLVTEADELISSEDDVI